eukprot:1605827-Ditylum_brightwellii.AAC.1
MISQKSRKLLLSYIHQLLTFHNYFKQQRGFLFLFLISFKTQYQEREAIHLLRGMIQMAQQRKTIPSNISGKRQGLCRIIFAANKN